MNYGARPVGVFTGPAQAIEDPITWLARHRDHRVGRAKLLRHKSPMRGIGDSCRHILVTGGQSPQVKAGLTETDGAVLP